MAQQLTETLERNARRHGEREAYRFARRPGDRWLSTSRREFELQTHTAARAFAALGLIEKDTVAICSPNCPQILIAEFGAFENRIAVIPIYASSSQSQFDFIVGNGVAKILFVGERTQYQLAANYQQAHPEVRIVVFDSTDIDSPGGEDSVMSWDEFMSRGSVASEEIGEEVARRRSCCLPEDMATLIYTSGTTGEPKGVAITHSNYNAAMRAHLRVLSMVKDTDLSMAFLPMSHILEKAWCFFCITKGIAIAINYDPRIISETIHEVHPNIMCCVPRFWEKVYAGIREKIATMSRVQQLMVRRALKVGRRRNLDFKRLGLRPSRLLEAEYRFWDKRVFSKLKHAIGIPNPNIYPTAGAPLSNRICEFMRSVGIEVTIGYGLSETTATVSFFRHRGYEIGTVGLPLPGVEVRIDPSNNEILVRGATVTPGYFKNPEANETAFTEDGFFRTGDAGYFTGDGQLVLTERVKDLFKTSNGKYVAPQLIESRLAENKYIDEAAVIGDRRKYVTALIVPNVPQLRRWAQSQGITDEDAETLCRDERARAFIMKQIAEVQQDLAEYEKIKKITLLPHHFSVMNGEVTNTMKVRRPVVAKRYADEIESMYGGE